jgi:phage tail P2-like protein
MEPSVMSQPGDTDDLLPPSATPWMRVNSKVSARILDTDADVIRRERDPSRCDAQFVPFLAWERSVHFYAPNDEAGNRARVASSFQDHVNYGSPAALEAEIALDTGYRIEVVEFFQDASLVWPWFFVQAVINPGDPLPDMKGAVMKSALNRKNVRDMPAVRIRVQQPAGALYVGAACNFAIQAKIFPQAAPPPPPQIRVGAAARFFPLNKILPQKFALHTRAA